NFINDLSTWYLRRSRDRFKGEDEKDKQAALQTTGYVLLELSKVMAPFMPFIAEQIWQRVSGNDFKDENKSVHLEGWPLAESRKQKTESRILEEMEVVRKIVELGLAKRDEAGIKVRQPLQKLEVRSKSPTLHSFGDGAKLEDEYVQLIKDEVNIKKVDFVKGEGDLEVELDTKLTAELKQEGIKRELVRFINNLRRNAGMTIQDKAYIFWQTDDKDIKKTIKKYKEDIMKDTLASEMDEGKSDEIDLGKEVKVNGIEAWLGIKLSTEL
ncbi:class I tRNA ligase family protein, partial [Candidatus Parcubacteria bacterium]|nr:class I tRNA ligase family protein [Candidatus Parcubacteria bacterium]